MKISWTLWKSAKVKKIIFIAPLRTCQKGLIPGKGQNLEINLFFNKKRLPKDSFILTIKQYSLMVPGKVLF